MTLNSMEDFQRDISYHLLKRDDGGIALTAKLRDRFHDIVMEIIVNSESLKIESAFVDFRKCPTAHCPDVSARLHSLIGVTIGKGLNRTLMEKLGGEEGCGNLRNMLLGLLPLALNVKAAAGFQDEQEKLDSIHEKLRGTCAGYPR